MRDMERWRRELLAQPLVVRLIWAMLAFEFASSLLTGRLSLAFVALATFLLSLGPVLFQRRFGIRLPVGMLVGIVLFIFATIFLGEAYDFYGRYWWWDILLHGGSAIGFGMMGFLFALMLFEGDRYAAPAWAIAFLGFCIAITVGAIWEIFEYGMDRLFGFNMQESGLDDTMSDLMVDTIGAALGAVTGFLYLKEREIGGLTGILREFVRNNRRLFRKWRR